MTNTVSPSPRWGTTTRLVVALTFVAVIAALMVRFQNIIPPLIMAFILVYLLYPLASFLNRKVRISWGVSVGIIYLLLIILLVGLLALGGLNLTSQIQSLIRILQISLNELPTYLERLSGQVIALGPFRFEMDSLDLNSISAELLSALQPLLGQTGSLVGTIASSALSTLGWLLFVLLVSYFVLIESRGLREGILKVDIPRYADDLRRISSELSRIWNAFLRGQIIIFVLTVVIYSVFLTVFGVRYAIGLALIAGLSRFLPYIGPAITWIVMAVVTYFQAFKPFSLSPLAYMSIVVGMALLIDQIFDNLVSPRIMAQALRVHPAAVLVAAIIAANLLGVLGVVIAAPILATFKLIGNYTLRKLLDLEPWTDQEPVTPPPPLREQVLGWWQRLQKISGLLKRPPAPKRKP